MKIFLDTANLDELKKRAAWSVVDGVTTNPSLIAKEGRPMGERIRMIRDITDKRLDQFLKDYHKAFQETPVAG